MTFLPYKPVENYKCFCFSRLATLQPGFVYYVGIPDISGKLQDADVIQNSESLLTWLLDLKLTIDLVHILVKNTWAQEARTELQKVIDDHRNAMPMFASCVVAQTLAFFAHKEILVSSGPNTSVPFLMLTLRAEELLGCVAPFANPLGSFWLGDMTYLRALLRGGRASLHVEPFYMKVSQTAEKLSHAEVRAQTQASDLQKRRAWLEDSVGILGEELANKKAHLKRVVDKIASDPTAATAPAAPSGATPRTAQSGSETVSGTPAQADAAWDLPFFSWEAAIVCSKDNKRCAFAVLPDTPDQHHCTLRACLPAIKRRMFPSFQPKSEQARTTQLEHQLLIISFSGIFSKLSACRLQTTRFPFELRPSVRRRLKRFKRLFGPLSIMAPSVPQIPDNPMAWPSDFESGIVALQSCCCFFRPGWWKSWRKSSLGPET